MVTKEIEEESIDEEELTTVDDLESSVDEGSAESDSGKEILLLFL